jgi:bifunctional DNA-binding transcriptional regulator/antitoxin component of YhaV-PrlF toxin-antitoxin module
MNSAIFLNNRKDGAGHMNNKKTISISEKRQITIPKKFFDALGFNSEAECVLRGNELIIRPVKENNGDFAAEILADLVEQGYSGEELVRQFKIKQKKVRPAVERMIEEADRVAEGKGEYYGLEDVFEQED